MAGGIFGLLGLIARHRGAVEYDFRSRFGLGLRDIGPKLTIAEAARLAAIFRDDPSSATAAAISGWSHPMSREALILADLIDLQAKTKVGKKWHGYPRPWPTDDGTRTRRGNAAGRTREQVIEILRRFGHS